MYGTIPIYTKRCCHFLIQRLLRFCKHVLVLSLNKSTRLNYIFFRLQSKNLLGSMCFLWFQDTFIVVINTIFFEIDCVFSLLLLLFVLLDVQLMYILLLGAFDVIHYGWFGFLVLVLCLRTVFRVCKKFELSNNKCKQSHCSLFFAVIK